ncbi:MAG: adenosylcobinamide-GDP ribazoletransferase [Roseiflexaceae bacterium]|nr:adenosylcobinamide-GDP ribazoletransferase [Roseiflexaceae bacterium]
MSNQETPNPWGSLWPLGEAIRFLTLIPVGGLPPMSDTSIGRAVPYFPAVGFIIGLLLLPVSWAAGGLWGPLVGAALVVVAWGVLTGGLHLDGVSDTFDAVMSWRPRERKLEIMKDSRIGAMGAMALVAVLLLKVAFLSAAGERWWQALLLAPMLGRWADIYGIVGFPAAREGGLGRSFQELVRPHHFVISSVLITLAALAIAGPHGLVAAALVWLVTHSIARWWTRDLGGLTGDTYGALCEIAEVVVLATLAAQA